MKKPWEYFDYCHAPYAPIASARGKFYSDVLLNNSLLGSPCQKQFLLVVNKLKKAVGPWNTVWGTKLDHDMLTWELYFYNHRSRDLRLTVTNVLKSLSPYFKMPKITDTSIEHQPYLMFSVDINEGVLSSKKIMGIRIYTEGRQGASSGYSYYWNGNRYAFENHYDFFMMPHEADKFVYKARQSIVLAGQCVPFLKHELIKRLMPCWKICHAIKQNREAVYFSRVDIDQLLYFLKWFKYPEHIVDFVSSNRDKLDHMLYDVAFDCSLGPKGIIFGKSSYYGTF